MNPQYPIYIISKGRWKRRQTVKTLEHMNVPYRIVIEPAEYKQYSDVIDPKKILVLPQDYKNLGSIPARNWVWEHSRNNGDERHWILDDNLEWIYRYHLNMKVKCASGTPFRIIEDFTDRYSNIGISGMNYEKFCPKDDNRPPLRFNIRLYSCLLLDNSLPFTWRGRYNEDTDLSLRVLKSGLCTVMFNAFLCGKRTTLVQSGGNTDELYAEEDARKKMAESLVEQHSDVASVTWKFNRWQHQVNYKPFEANLLKHVDETIGYPAIDNFGLELVREK